MLSMNVSASPVITRDIYKSFYSLHWIGHKFVRPYANIIYVDGKVAYCIEPGTPITEEAYTINNNFLNEEQKLYIELLSYYGYNSEKNTIFDYMITQEMIWEYIYETNTDWTDNPTTNQPLNLEEYRTNILKDIENHNIEPSFKDITINGYENQIIELTDENNVLENYKIVSKNKNNVKIEGNKLIITITKESNETVKFIKKEIKVEDTVLYDNSSSQAFAVIGLNELHQKPFEIKIKNLGSQLKFLKQGEVINYEKENYIDTESLKDIDFKLYTIDHELIDIHTTDKDGILFRDSILPEGEYYLMEVQAEEYIEIPFIYFTVDNENEIIIDDDNIVNNYLKKGNIKIIKKDMEERLLSNTKFGLYTEADKLLDEKTTNEFGEILFENIPYGNYYIKEIEAAFGYIKSEEKYPIFIEENNKTYELTIYNEIIKELPKTGLNKNVYKIMSMIDYIIKPRKLT